MSIFEYDEEATMKYIRECEYEAGRTQGVEAGRTDSIIEILKEKGSVSNEFTDIIKSQKDIQTLQTWLKYAVKAKDIEEFQELIKN